MTSLYTSAQCRELDRIAIAEHGIPGFELMQRAGRAAFDVLVDRWPGIRSITLFCGKGNNAGDGYIVAGLARQLGFDVQLLQIDSGELQGDAAKARDWAAARGVAPTPASKTSAPTSEMLTPASETLAPMSKTPTPASEMPTPASETSMPMSEMLTPASETPAPMSKTPTPASEMPAPASETSTPMSEMPAPASETSTPMSETSAPASEMPAPVSEAPTPASEMPAPASEAPAPASEAPAPASEALMPASETPAPASEALMPANETPAAMSEVLRGDVLVDAMLGTGLKGALREPYLGAVRRINASGRPVLALDVPTGVNGDTGGLAGEAVRASVTVSFIGPKLGLHTGPALDHRGELVHAGLGVPPSVLEAVPGCPLLKFDAHALPRLDPSLYKHRMGHLVVLGGDKGMGGAPIMAGEAALRAGTGLVSLATHAVHRPAALARRPELMVQDAEDGAAIVELLGRATAVVLGPGLGRNPWGEQLFHTALEAAKPMLIDADGLRWLADLRAKPRAAAVITPHAAEAAHLLGLSPAEVQANRPQAALKLAETVGGVVVLKGAGTVCAEPGRLLGVCGHGNPGMATAGMGDALSGLIGGFLAQGFSAAQAATLGTCLHSCAADLAAERLGQRSLLAADLFPALAELLR